jgi:hypothetical protein
MSIGDGNICELFFEGYGNKKCAGIRVMFLSIIIKNEIGASLRLSSQPHE